MTTRDELRVRLDDLEKRLDELHRVFGALAEMSATLETAVELLVERGLIHPQQLRRRAGAILASYQERCEPGADELFDKPCESILDAQLESLDEEDMARA